MKFLLTCLVLLYPLAAAAQSPEAPRSMSDCERIKGDLAYNQCLASFGPKRGERGAGGAGVGNDDDVPATTRSQRNARPARRARGRQAAAFDVVSGRRGAARGAGRSGPAALSRQERGSRRGR
jgi:hypothetical protein